MTDSESDREIRMFANGVSVKASPAEASTGDGNRNAARLPKDPCSGFIARYF